MQVFKHVRGVYRIDAVVPEGESASELDTLHVCGPDVALSLPKESMPEFSGDGPLPTQVPAPVAILPRSPSGAGPATEVHKPSRSDFTHASAGCLCVGRWTCVRCRRDADRPIS
jgi:hypothetical protein